MAGGVVGTVLDEEVPEEVVEVETEDDEDETEDVLDVETTLEVDVVVVRKSGGPVGSIGISIYVRPLSKLRLEELTPKNK